MNTAPSQAQRPIGVISPGLDGRVGLTGWAGHEVLEWPDGATMARDIGSACADDRVVVRWVGGALLSDLSLQENLYLESALSTRSAPDWLWRDLGDLFAAAGAPIADDWAAVRPGQAAPLARWQARVGRALAADPDALLIDADAWPDDVVSPEGFSRAFLHCYPWRALAWCSADPKRVRGLRERLAGVDA